VQPSGDDIVTSKRKSSSPSDLFRRDLLLLIPQLRAFARSLCTHRELAEDMAQSTLAKAWQAHTAFKPGTNLRAWLFTILRNEFYTYRRRSWRQSHWDEIKGGLIATPAEPQHWALELSDATRGLRELPDGQRESLILVAAAGFSYDEAAEICGVPVGTIKSRVARGRLALADMLAGAHKFQKPSLRTDSSNDILAQLAALTPAGASRAAFA
jgi:RNA polymerase sigma-70 factor (ECF subfamily)